MNDNHATLCASEEWGGICELLENWLPGRVLEFGAGRGISSFAFACVGCDVTCLEPDPSPLVGRGAIAELFHFAPRPLRLSYAGGEFIVHDGPFELYDLKADAGERNNVADSHPDVIAKITQFLKTARTEDKNWPITAMAEK